MKHAAAEDIGSQPASEADSRDFCLPGMPVGSVRSGGGRQLVVPRPLQVTDTPPNFHKSAYAGAHESPVVFLFANFRMTYHISITRVTYVRKIYCSYMIFDVTSVVCKNLLNQK